MLLNKLKNYLAGYLPINLVQAVAALGLVAIYSRLLTPDQYGRYALVIIIVQWGQSLLFSWLYYGVSRFHEAARIQDGLATLLATVYVTAISLIGVLALGAGLALGFLDDNEQRLVAAGLTYLAARSLLLIGLEAHRAARRVWRYTWLEGLQYLFSVGLGALLIYSSEDGAVAALWGGALTNLVLLLLDTPYLLKQIRRPVSPGSDLLYKLASYGFPLALSSLLSLIIAGSDRFFIAWLMDERAVGVYSVAYALADRPLSILFSWVGMAAVPLAFAAMERDGVAAARQIVADTGKTLILLLLPCAAGLAAIAAPMAATLVGADFRLEATHIIPWIALAGLLHGGMIHYAAHAFLITHNTRLLLVTNIATAIINVLLNLWLIPIFGLNGAIAATVITYGAGLILRVILAKRCFDLPLLWSQMFRGLLACGVMMGLLKIIAFPLTFTGLALAMVTGAVSYAVAALLFNVADCRRWALARWQRNQEA